MKPGGTTVSAFSKMTSPRPVCSSARLTDAAKPRFLLFVNKQTRGSFDSARMRRLTRTSRDASSTTITDAFGRSLISFIKLSKHAFVASKSP